MAELEVAGLFWQANFSRGGLTDSNTNYHYLHSNHLGTPMLATGKDGTVDWNAVSEAFGATGSLPESSIVMNLRFPGQYFDAETGNYYNFNRDYGPNIGRYIQADPVGLDAGVNLFLYAEGDSVSKVDPVTESCSIFP
jgi:RHS repeat-associated protein